MKYLVPPIVIPVLLFIGIAAYAMLRPPIIVGHAPAAAANVSRTAALLRVNEPMAALGRFDLLTTGCPNGDYAT
jgi:hypothetical protein